MISAIIPTRWSWNFDKLKNLLISLEAQILSPEEILIIIDFDVPRKPLLDFIVSCVADASLWEAFSDKIKIECQDAYGVSSARNWGIKLSKNQYILLCDDDILLNERNCLERMVDEYVKIEGAKKRKDENDEYSESRSSSVRSQWLILYPTILFHNTGAIQSQWFVGYNWLMCWPVPKYAIERKSKLWNRLLHWLTLLFGARKDKNNNIQLTGSICIFSEKDVLLKNLYDEKFSFIYEDLEWSYRAWKRWIQIINSEDISIQHWEKQKDVLAWSYIDRPENVYLKTRHRIWFVLKHANRYQKILFYSCGFWVSNAWTLVYILLYGRRKENLMKSWRKGIVDGLTVGMDR